MRHRSAHRLLVSAPMMTVLGFVAAARGQDAAAGSSPSRIVHQFDFDERGSGNLEEVPKYWDTLRPSGFPHYTHGSFDYEMGHDAPPSFHLTSEGRNAAYQYAGPETKIRANTDYRIEGYIRGDGLRSARACLSAHFLDHHGQPLPDTLVRSPWIGGLEQGDGWNRVELHLAAAPPQARTIGLVAWVLQEPEWNTSSQPKRHIPRVDLHGGAWFDDITVFALPRVRLETSAMGNVMTPEDVQEIQVLLADNNSPAPEGRLSILAADGDLVETHAIPARIGQTDEPVGIPVAHLSPGLYTARLDVLSGGLVIVSRTLRFARLADRIRSNEAAARSFGVAINPRERAEPAAELALLDRQAVRAVKLPVWTGLPDDPRTAPERRTLERLLQELVRRGFVLSGVFFGPPAMNGGAQSGGDENGRDRGRPLLDLLAGDPNVWKDHLAAVVVPNAGLFRWWQIGTDGEPPTAKPGELERAVTQLREAMRPLITLPQLSLPLLPDAEAAPSKAPVEQVVLNIGPDVSAQVIPAQLQRYRSAGYEQVSVYLEPLPDGGYDRVARLSEWARRVVAARHAGAATVVVPQPWRLRESVQGVLAEPSETFILLRTIADIVGDGEPGPQIRVGDGVTALAFHRGATTTLALWDTSAPPEGRIHAIQLGKADRQIDAWGVDAVLPRDERGRQLVRVSPMPTFVPGVERWLIDFRASITIDPAQVEAGQELVTHSIQMAYRGDHAVTGRAIIDGPKSWEISPTQFSFSALPQRVRKQAIEMRYPHNEPAGRKTVTAKIDLEGGGYYLEVPLTIEIGVTDIEVWGSAVVDRDTLVLRHVVTNRSPRSLSFRGSAMVPGHERQYRPIADLRPGDTQTVQYRFSGGQAMIGRTARLTLREVNDGPRVHNLDVTVP